MSVAPLIDHGRRRADEAGGREASVPELKALIARGEYWIDAEAVAEAILRRLAVRVHLAQPRLAGSARRAA